MAFSIFCLAICQSELFGKTTNTPSARHSPLHEGPEIRRAADKLAAAIAGQRVTRIFFAFDHLKPYESRLQGETVDRVTARSKAILNRFSIVNAEQLAARLSEKQYRRRCLMGLLQDQGVMAGMGNYLCCEALHVAGIHPQHRPADLSATQLRRLTDSCLHLVRQSYRTGGITNNLEQATILRQQGASFEASRFHVYRRAGLPCYRCGTDIIKGRFCGRMGYLCPGCQRQRLAE